MGAMARDGRRQVERSVHEAVHGETRERLARVGLAAKGVLNVSLGLLVVQVAQGTESAEEASAKGAIEQLARQPLGRWLLALLTLGLAALTLWNLLRASTGDPVEDDDDRVGRAKYALFTVLYAITTLTAAGVLIANWGEDGEPSSAGTGSGGGTEEAAAGFLFDLPGGRWLVAGLGIAIAASGVATVLQHAVRSEFRERLALQRLSPGAGRAVEAAGRGGYAARGVVLGIVGLLFVAAAVQHDADEAGGLSEALTTLTEQSWGPPLLWLVAIGFVLYGLFAFAEARYRRAA
ncbi:MAG: DUF1206 domain-containing protein [Acidimicrobiales bacterium]|jgi:hypothetical protein|nr:DUF1206 domain-containing protein [Acidimicrobiales bacterium]